MNEYLARAEKLKEFLNVAAKQPLPAPAVPDGAKAADDKKKK